jgi:phytoene synthase
MSGATTVPMTVPALEVDYAYAECEGVTRREAANFYFGIRLLPRPRRQAMSAVYAFARRIDDIGDGDLPTEEKLAALAAQRESLAALDGDADGAGPVAIALAHAQHHYGLPVEALELLIDGVEMDVRDARYETFDELLVYCRQVAGSIGRLCLAIFTDGAAGEAAAGLADDLGVAMQLTNIIRDVREDQARGRVYLPREDLSRFGFEELPQAPGERADQLIRFEAARARSWFERGLGLVERLDPRSAACVLAMTGIYRSILDRIEREPSVVLSRRVSLPAWEKAWLAARSVAGAAGSGALSVNGRTA